MFLSYYRDPSIPFNDYHNQSVPLQLNCACGHSFPHGVKANSVRRDYYLFYLLEGTVRIETPIRAVMKSGDLIIFEPNTPFSYVAHDAAHPASTHYAAHFTGYLAGDLLTQCHLITNTVYAVKHTERISAAFQSLFRTFLTRDELFDLHSANCLTSLLLTVGRILSPRAVTSHRMGEQPLRASLKYIHENFEKEISVHRLAQIEHLSPSRYRALFCSVMKQPPHDYIMMLRLHAACELLRQSELGILQVAETVGYTDGRYFSRLFRKKYGMTPSEYRKK